MLGAQLLPSQSSNKSFNGPSEAKRKKKSVENVQESASYCYVVDGEIIMPSEMDEIFFGSDYSDNEDSDDFDSDFEDYL